MATGYPTAVPSALAELHRKATLAMLQQIREEEQRRIAASPHIIKRYPMEPQSPLDYTPTETIGFKDWSL